MAAVKSLILLVVSAPFDGLAVRESLCRADFAALDLTFGRRSETIGPDADGGAFEDVGFGAGDWARETGDES